MGKGRRAIEKIEKKKQGVSIGSKRQIVTTMDPEWFIAQSLIFSSGGSLGIVETMRRMATMTTTNMTMMAHFQCFQSGRVSSPWSGSFWLWDLSRNSFVPTFRALPADKREQGCPSASCFSQDTMVSFSNFSIPSWSFSHRPDLPPVNTPEHSQIL